MSFNVRICKIIDDHGSNVSEFAKMINVNRLTVQRWINGQRVMHTGNITEIYRIWPDVDLHWLLTGEERK